jgi:hypothetical protein
MYQAPLSLESAQLIEARRLVLLGTDLKMKIRNCLVSQLKASQLSLYTQLLGRISYYRKHPNTNIGGPKDRQNYTE